MNRGQQFGLLVGLILVPVASSGQVMFGPGDLATAFGKAYERFEIFPFEPQINKPGYESSTFAPSSVKISPLRPGESSRNQKFIRIVHGGNVSQTGNLVQVDGGAEIIYRGYTIQANKITADRVTKIFTASGDAHLDGPGEKVVARKIIIDFKNKTYQSFQGEATLEPSIIGGGVLTNVYLSGKESSGNNKESLLTDGIVTTCPYPDPHYYLKSRYVDIRYGRRVLFRHVSLYILDHKIFSVPLISIPIDDRSYRNLPYVGQDPIEGYFIKTHYGIPMKGANSLFTRLDYMTRLGIGLGANYSYIHGNKFGGYSGDFGFYGVTGARSFDLNEDHLSKFSWGTIRILNAIQNHDYNISPDGVIVQNQVGLTMPSKRGTFALNYSRSDNSASGFDNQNQSLGLNSFVNWSSQFKTSLQATYNDQASSYSISGTPTATDRKTISVTFDAQDNLKKATAALDYERTIPVGTVQNFYSGVEETPNLTLSTDSERLLGSKVGVEVPFLVSASIGQFGDPNSGGMLTRDFFKFNSNKTWSNSDNRSQFQLNTQFTQGLYSDNTAQYSLAVGTNYHYRFGHDTSFDFNYNYLRPEGFSPLGIDSTGKLNVISTDFSVRPIRSLLVGLQSGYDALQISNGFTPWQPVGVRIEYSPASWLLARTNAIYDPYIKSWSNIRFDMSYDPGATRVGLGVRYDATRHIFGNVNGFVQALKWGRTKVDLLATYDGYAKQFTNRQLSIVYDLHDAELIFQVINNQFGFQNGTQFAVYFRLKALPFTTGFGSGTRGQPIGIGTGVGY